MAEGRGLVLAAMGGVGFLFIQIGMSGKLGSLIGAIIDPANMQEGSSSGGFASSATSAESLPPANSVTTMIRSVFGPAYADAAIKIATAESSLNAKAYNSISVGGSHAQGIFQVLVPSTWNSTSYAQGNPYDALTNIKAAYEIFRRDGYSWREWSTAPGLGLS